MTFNISIFRKQKAAGKIDEGDTNQKVLKNFSCTHYDIKSACILKGLRLATCFKNLSLIYACLCFEKCIFQQTSRNISHEMISIPFVVKRV